ncbi:MAG: hypothetical protein WDO15_28075 [Bacteroidota bacterium]
MNHPFMITMSNELEKLGIGTLPFQLPVHGSEEG